MMNDQVQAAQDIRAARYVAAIRNKRKREYASAYLKFLRGESSAEPTRGELSYMAAQAVGMNLSIIYRGEDR